MFFEDECCQSQRFYPGLQLLSHCDLRVLLINQIGGVGFFATAFKLV